MLLVVDSGAISRLAERNERAVATLSVLKKNGAWPPVVPSVVLVECLTGKQRTDAIVHRFLNDGCDIRETLTKQVAQRAGELRTQTKRASKISVVNAVVVSSAEPDGIVLSTDPKDLRALAAPTRVVVEEV